MNFRKQSFTNAFPKNWEIVRLGEILEYEQPGKYIVRGTNYKDEYKTPVLTAGKTFILGYTKETFGINNNLPIILFDDFTTTSKFVNFPFKLKSSACKILRTRSDNINLRVIFELIQMISFNVKNHKRYWISEYQNLKIPLPPLWEQEKIAKILSAADCLIQNTQALITQKERYKKGLCQKLFSQKLRFKGFKDKWKETKLGEVLEESNLRNTELKINKVLSVTNSLGFVSQEEHFQRNIASKNLANYKIIYNGDFAYNPARINVGSIALLDNFLNGILSPMYIVFKCLNIDKYFLKYWLDSFLFKGILHRFLSGSVRQTLNFSEMKQMPIKLPSLKEQQKIAEILNLYDKEIDLLKEKLLLLKNQKQALMQQLLSGKVRVRR